ncbi:MAG: DegV family protein [Ruminococcaceae bacterium]|nr:DegV family protein [Oscillospiraceae bacterium]
MLLQSGKKSRQTAHPIHNRYEVPPMSYKIIADSSSDLFALDGADYAFVPLTIHCEDKSFTDGPTLDIAAMNAALKASKKPSGTSCPSIGDWIEAFSGAEEVFAVTITGSLSGSYASAVAAADQYCTAHPGRKVCVIDSLSTGPEMVLLIDKIVACKRNGVSFEQTEQAVRDYAKRTHLLFALQSMNNLVKNGRISRAKATIAGVLGIRAIGKASEKGTLEMLKTCRGENKTVAGLYEEMIAHGYTGGRVFIAHCLNPALADKTEQIIRKTFPNAEIAIRPTGGLCSYYAEEGGILVGYESN